MGIICIIGLTYGGNQFKDFYGYNYPLSSTALEIRRGLNVTYLAKSLTTPINEIEKAAAEMEAGSLGAIIEYKSQDELGSLAVSMQTLCTDMKEIIVDIGRILQSLANGDFHVTSLYLNLFVGDYEPILSSMRLIRDNLNDAMTQISQSADQVALSSEQLAEQNAK